MKTSEACRRLKLTRNRVDQWLHQDYLVLDCDIEYATTMSEYVALTCVGRDKSKQATTRSWTVSDAMRALILRNLSDIGVSLALVGPKLVGLHGFKGEKSFFVVSTGKYAMLIPSSNIGDPPPDTSKLPKFYASDMPRFEHVRESRLAALLADPTFFAGVVISVDAVEEEAKAAFGVAD